MMYSSQDVKKAVVGFFSSNQSAEYDTFRKVCIYCVCYHALILYLTEFFSASHRLRSTYVTTAHSMQCLSKYSLYTCTISC